MRVGLGMDTGGTYTDAVLMDLDSGDVLSKSKSMTTHEDLSIGIRGALALLDGEILPQAGVVVLSSTLATNSIVEGRGCRVGLLCIGDDYNMDLRPDLMARVAGGHDINGREEEPLDEDGVRRALESMRGRVDSLAISGFLSIRNPDHELRARALAREILGVPVVCSHELSSGLGFNERTTTCIMNGRLVLEIDELITSVQSVLADMGVRAPLMMFRGNGSVMSAEVARERPVETILSGPAASLVGAMHMTGIRDAVVMDIGGTTTDIGILRGGRPSLEKEGATIGGKRTRVLAANITTSGLGGDSRITVNEGRIVLMPQRVIPLCVASSRWPEVGEYLRRLASWGTGRMSRPVNLRNTVFDSELVCPLKAPRGADLPEADRRLLEVTRHHPMAIKSAARMLHCEPEVFDITMMEEYGYIQRIGLTPTDILHADGTYREFDHRASLDGIRHMAALLGTDPDTFVREARDGIRNKMSGELLGVLLSEETGEQAGPQDSGLALMAITRRQGRDMRCAVTLDKPIVGLGASSGVYVRWMADVFGTDVIICGDSDVGNAVGAVTASVTETVEVLIRPAVMTNAQGDYEAYSRMGRFRYGSLQEAVDGSVEMASARVAADAERSHAEDVVVTVDEDRHPYMTMPGGREYDEVVLTVTATGRPRAFRPTGH